jgi:hypothetical protein
MHSTTTCTKYPSCIFKYIPFHHSTGHGGEGSIISDVPSMNHYEWKSGNNTTTNLHTSLKPWIFILAFKITMPISMWCFMERIFMSYKKVVISNMYILSCSHDITTTNLPPCKTCITTKKHTRVAFQSRSYRSHSNDDTRSCFASKDRNRATHRKQLWEPLWQV